MFKKGVLSVIDKFKGFTGYTQDEFKELWENAIVAVDTNILINFYRFSSKDSSGNLLETLKKLKEENKLWIPHHVVLEYFYNYEKELDKPKEGYRALTDKTCKLIKQAERNFSSTESDYPYITTEKFRFFLDELQESYSKFNVKIEQEIEDLPDTEVIKEEVLELIRDIIGQPYTQQEIDKIEDEGSKRYNNNVPPGWKDGSEKGNNQYRVYGSIKYHQKYGDLIVWNQIVDKAKNDSIPIIFLTEEKKEDWWEMDGRSIKKPQPNLIHEFQERAGQNFYMYRSDNFMVKANSHFKDFLSSEQIESFTKDIENIRNTEVNNEKDYYEQFIRIKENQEQIANIDVNKLLKYCDESEKSKLKTNINKAFTKDNLTFSNNLYEKVISRSLEKLTPRLVNNAIDLITEISQKDFGKGNEYRKKLYDMPEDTVSKGLALIDFNERLENYLNFNDSDLPF